MQIESANVEMRPADYWQILVRRRWVIFSFFVICVSTVVLGTFLMTPLYRATTNVIIEGENTNVLKAEESGASGTSLDIYENYLETQMAYIRSENVAGKVFEEFKLDQMPRYKDREGWQKILQKRFDRDIYLKRLPGTRMVQISVENPDAKLSAELANRLADIYSADNRMRRALTFIRNQRMASLNSEFLKLQEKYDALSNVYGPKHPDMIALREEIRAMSDRINTEGHVENPTQAPKVRSEEQTLLEDTLLKIQENSVLSSSKMDNIAIVDRAQVPEKIAKPKMALNILLGLFLGLFGGLALAFLIDYLDDTIKTDDDLKRRLGNIVFLGVLLSEKSSGRAAMTANDHIVDTRLESASAEAYRLIRTRLLWSIEKDTKLKDLAILSSIPGEGKTTVASNLAIALAQLKMKILLVDTDIRKGRLNESYELPQEKGLGNFLTESLSLSDVVQKTSVENLSIVACGKSVIETSQLFSSPRIKDFIQKARAEFDMVLYDTPPVTVIADTAILIPQLDGAILTVRGGLTGRRVLNQALSTIRESKANLIGVVLNDASSTDNPRYSRYYKEYHRK